MRKRLLNIISLVCLKPANWLLCGCCMLLIACSSDDYRNAIPSSSVAIMSIDANRLANSEIETLIKSKLKTDDIAACGIDFEEKIYLFEDAEGNFGLCAKLSSENDLTKQLERISRQKVSKKRDYRFAIIDKSWLAGYSDNTLLVMGPVAMSKQLSVQQQIIRYLEQSEDKGILNSPLYERVDTATAPVAMVLQANALPEAITSVFTLGVPRNVSASDVFISAQIRRKDMSLIIDGEVFSMNQAVNDSIAEAKKAFRTVKGRYLSGLTDNDLLAISINIEGRKLVNMLQGNAVMQALLTGANSVIDMNSILNSTDGDLAVMLSPRDSSFNGVKLYAELADTDWIKDVDYWKKSCPKGGVIKDVSTHSWSYHNGTDSFLFGVTPDKQFYVCSKNAQTPFKVWQVSDRNVTNKDIAPYLLDNKQIIIMNVPALSKYASGSYLPLLRRFVGDVQTIIYRVR